MDYIAESCLKKTKRWGAHTSGIGVYVTNKVKICYRKRSIVQNQSVTVNSNVLVCVCAYVYMSVCGYTGIYMHVETRGQPWVLFQEPCILFFFEMWSLTGLGSLIRLMTGHPDSPRNLPISTS